MKYPIYRSCGHQETVKVYDRYPLNDKKNEKHTFLVLLREELKNCRECSLKNQATGRKRRHDSLIPK